MQWVDDSSLFVHWLACSHSSEQASKSWHIIVHMYVTCFPAAFVWSWFIRGYHLPADKRRWNSFCWRSGYQPWQVLDAATTHHIMLVTPQSKVLKAFYFLLLCCLSTMQVDELVSGSVACPVLSNESDCWSFCCSTMAGSGRSSEVWLTGSDFARFVQRPAVALLPAWTF